MPVARISYYAQIYNDLVFQTLKKRLGDHGAAVFARSATAGGQRFPVHVSDASNVYMPPPPDAATRDCDGLSGEETASRRTRPWPNRLEVVSV
jgi:hypothetical protein